MRNPFSSKDLSESMRRRVELAVAVSQERLLNTHVDHALRLIQLVGDQVPFENALSIYTRLLRLSDDEARVITTRALAALGEQAARSDVWPELVTEEPEDVTPDTGTANGRRSFIRSMRQRLRGRVKDELRRMVELAAARTEVALLDTHVENALSFVDMLGHDLQASEAVELYLEALEVRDSVAEVTYYLALARLADEQLPKRPLPRAEPAPAEGRKRTRISPAAEV